MGARLSSSSLLTGDFEATPYWWRAAPPLEPQACELPARCDMVVVGSGFGGTCAALTAARAGLSVALLDSGSLGAGACSRNMGGLAERIDGADPNGLRGRSLRDCDDAGAAAAQYVRDLISNEGIDCRLQTNGSLRFATSQKTLAAMAHDVAQRRSTDPDCFDRVLDKHELRHEIAGTFADRYVGAHVTERQSSLHPGLLIQGLLKAARDSGVMLYANTPVHSVSRVADRSFVITTSRGGMKSAAAVVMTAGYSTAAFPVLRDRIFPFGAHVIATDPIDEDVFVRINPKRRMLSNTRLNWMLIMPVPGEPRLLFAGEYLRTPDPIAVAGRLRAELVTCFPELSSVRVANAWFGSMPIPSTMVPQIIEADGVIYGAAAGWSLAAHMGHKGALRAMGRPGAESLFDHVKFAPFPRPFRPPSRLRLPARWGMRALDRLNMALGR